MSPDPAYITNTDWSAISGLLYSLWMILGGALGFGFSILAAHGLIPSLVATRDMDATRAIKVRPVLYGISLAFLLFGLYSVWLFISRLGIVSSIFWGGAQ